MSSSRLAAMPAISDLCCLVSFFITVSLAPSGFTRGNDSCDFLSVPVNPSMDYEEHSIVIGGPNRNPSLFALG